MIYHEYTEPLTVYDMEKTALYSEVVCPPIISKPNPVLHFAAGATKDI
jgi:hypothetical protein